MQCGALLIDSETVKVTTTMSLIPFKPYSSISISGMTQSGKSTWVFRLLLNINKMFEDVPKYVLYCYGVYQSLYDDIKSQCPFVTFHEGLPNEETIKTFATGEHRMIVLDDLLNDVVQSREMEKLFVLGCHHRHLTTCFLNQNLYQNGRCARTIALNTTYLILFKNYRDTSQLVTLGRQLVPGHHKALVEAYKDATTSERYGYLVIDMSPHSEDRFRWRTHVFPGEDPIIYEI